MAVGRRIRFGAVLLGVVLALTGFSSGHKSGHKSSGGGGCSSSSSSSKNNRSSNSYNNRNTTRGGSGSTASPTPTPTPTGAPARAEVVTCAGPATPKATVRVTSLASAERTVEVPITFEGASGTVERTSGRVTLKKGETRTIEIPLGSSAKAAQVTSCRLGRVT
ncbi:hypothetical protein ABZ934_29625 [Streptomyces sp. NPDC046557]|uniref:hypothetical protein n=1 Tax=Streptomyces sp. NPDC046557 TaxID=3155372 RepID=UPI0033F75FF9